MPALLPKAIRVVIVDDQVVVRAGMRLLLESRPGLVVIGEASTGVDALAVVAREQPDVVLLDLGPGDEVSLDIIPELLAAAPETRVLTLTGTQDPGPHRRAVCLGAVGLVPKNGTAEVLFRAIEKVHAGEAWLDRRMMASVHHEMTRGREVRNSHPEEARISKLTRREREIVRLVAEPLKNRQIAARLAIAEPTVRHHLTSIFEKMGVDGRLGLVVYAYRHGLGGPYR